MTIRFYEPNCRSFASRAISSIQHLDKKGKYGIHIRLGSKEHRSDSVEIVCQTLSVSVCVCEFEFDGVGGEYMAKSFSLLHTSSKHIESAEIQLKRVDLICHCAYRLSTPI